MDLELSPLTTGELNGIALGETVDSIRSCIVVDVLKNTTGESNGTTLQGQNGLKKDTKIVFEAEDEPLFLYDVFDNPPIPLTIGFAMQGPTATYVVPLLALMTLPQWMCPDEIINNGGLWNETHNVTMFISTSVKLQRLEGSLMIAGGLHILIGLTGIIGILLRFIGPITVVPALTIMGLYVYSATVRFVQSQWGIGLLTVATALILSFYLGKRRMPIPWWSRARGCHIVWSHCHKMFSILFATVVGWVVSAILTAAGALRSDPESAEFYARTDSRMQIVYETNWFIFPYPGQFGPPLYDTGALVTFVMGTIGSVIDSIGDYYACIKVIDAPPPPRHAINRGIAVEGFMSFIAGWAGASHATSTFGGNIGAIGITRVASLRVFQILGVLFIVMGIIGKLGAFFVTIPYAVIGGLQIINFGVLIGVMLSNLQFVDMGSKRNLTIIGVSMLVSLMLPHWIKTTKDAVNTGIKDLDNTILMFLANPVFMAGLIACFLDNTMPGTLEQRGITAWQCELTLLEEPRLNEKVASQRDPIRAKKLTKTIYVIPYINTLLRRFPWMRHIPICQRYNANPED